MRVYFFTLIIVVMTSVLAQLCGFNRKLLNRTSHNSFFVFLTGVVLIGVAGCRWLVGTDYWQYAVNYSRYVTSWWVDLKSFDEPGLKLIAKLSSVIYNDYATMFLLSSVLTVGLSVRTIARKSDMFTFSILLYIFIGAWHGSFNGVRQYLACSVIFAGHQYIIDRKLKHYLLTVLVASLFHVSALSMVALYFIPMKKLEGKELFLLVSTSLVFLYSSEYVLRVIEVYFRKNTSTLFAQREVNVWRIVVQIAPLVIYSLLTDKSKLGKSDMFYVNILFVNAALSVATSGSAYLARFPIYTGIFSTLGYPRLVNYDDKNLRALVVVTILAFYSMYWYIEVSGSANLNDFRWIFNRV